MATACGTSGVSDCTWYSEDFFAALNSCAPPVGQGGFCSLSDTINIGYEAQTGVSGTDDNACAVCTLNAVDFDMDIGALSIPGLLECGPGGDSFPPDNRLYNTRTHVEDCSGASDWAALYSDNTPPSDRCAMCLLWSNQGPAQTPAEMAKMRADCGLNPPRCVATASDCDIFSQMETCITAASTIAEHYECSSLYTDTLTVGCKDSCTTPAAGQHGLDENSELAAVEAMYADVLATCPSPDCDIDPCADQEAACDSDDACSRDRLAAQSCGGCNGDWYWKTGSTWYVTVGSGSECMANPLCAAIVACNCEHEIPNVNTCGHNDLIRGSRTCADSDGDGEGNRFDCSDLDNWGDGTGVHSLRARMGQTRDGTGAYSLSGTESFVDDPSFLCGMNGDDSIDGGYKEQRCSAAECCRATLLPSPPPPPGFTQVRAYARYEAMGISTIPAGSMARAEFELEFESNAEEAIPALGDFCARQDDFCAVTIHSISPAGTSDTPWTIVDFTISFSPIEGWQQTNRWEAGEPPLDSELLISAEPLAFDDNYRYLGELSSDPPWSVDNVVVTHMATCGDADGDGDGTAAVSDEDCGEGFSYDVTASASTCAGATCDISGVAVDKTTCCVAQATCGTDYTDLDCYPGAFANTTASASFCAGAACDISGVAADKTACCTALATCGDKFGDGTMVAVTDAECGSAAADFNAIVAHIYDASASASFCDGNGRVAIQEWQTTCDLTTYSDFGACCKENPACTSHPCNSDPVCDYEGYVQLGCTTHLPDKTSSATKATCACTSPLGLALGAFMACLFL
eukprot:COSAG02_NODE_8_length_60691_cov_104.994752_8_plen_802_part_00